MTLKSSIKVRRIKKIIIVLRSSWSLVNSPYQYLWAVRRICTLMLGVKSKSQLCEVQPFCWANQMLANFTKIYKDITSLLFTNKQYYLPICLNFWQAVIWQRVLFETSVQCCTGTKKKSDYNDRNVYVCVQSYPINLNFQRWKTARKLWSFKLADDKWLKNKLQKKYFEVNISTIHLITYMVN